MPSNHTDFEKMATPYEGGKPGSTPGNHALPTSTLTLYHTGLITFKTEGPESHAAELDRIYLAVMVNQL